MSDPRDALLLGVTPMVVAPYFGPPLTPLTGSCHRFIVAQNGIWLELVRPWLHVVTKVAEGAVVRLPAGTLSESITLPIKIPQAFLAEFVRRAKQTNHLEQAAFITLAPDGVWSLVDVGIISNGAGHISYQCPRLPAGHEMAIDLHSHAKYPAIFSLDDNIDDNEMVKLAIVIGNCDRDVPTIAARLCVLGKFIPIQLEIGSLCLTHAELG